MRKKILICILCLVTALVTVVSATGTGGTAENTMPTESATPVQTPPQQGGGRPGGGRGGMGGERPQMPEGGMTPPEGEMPQMPEGEFTPPGEEMQQGTDESQPAETPQNPDDGEAAVPGQDMGRGQWRQSDTSQTETGQNTPATVTDFLKEYQTPVIAVILLIFAFVFVKLYKRKNY